MTPLPSTLETWLAAASRDAVASTHPYTQVDALPAVLPITPICGPVEGSVVLPGSKSLTNRALMLAALAHHEISLEGVLFSQDTFLMSQALNRLGFTVEVDFAARVLKVAGHDRGFTPGAADLDVGLAGTAARFLTALCATAPQGTWRIDGVPQMRKRPMAGLITALRDLGVRITCEGEEGYCPLTVHAAGLPGGTVEIDAAESSQLLSGLLMAAPRAHGPITVKVRGTVRRPFVAMTLRLMAEFGHPPVAEPTPGVFVFEGPQDYHLPSPRYAIEPDATAASYFMALPLVTGGQLHLPGTRGPGDGLQGDTHFVDVMRQVGVDIAVNAGGLTAKFNRGARGRGVTVDFSQFSDTFLTLAALAPLLAGPTTITGIAHTRLQETDRVAGMARELRKLGQAVEELPDSLTITPQPLRAGQEIETYHDHRFAMSFALLGCHDLRGNGQPWLSLRDPACCAKTFPHFFGLLADLHPKVSSA